jgi:hypothetical protein
MDIMRSDELSCMVVMLLALFLPLLSAASSNESHVDFKVDIGEGRKWQSCSAYAVKTVPFDESAFVPASRMIPDLNKSLTRWGWDRGPASKKCFDYEEKGCR